MTPFSNDNSTPNDAHVLDSHNYDVKGLRGLNLSLIPGATFYKSFTDAPSTLKVRQLLKSSVVLPEFLGQDFDTPSAELILYDGSRRVLVYTLTNLALTGYTLEVSATAAKGLVVILEYAVNGSVFTSLDRLVAANAASHD